MSSVPVTDLRSHLAQLLADAVAAALPEQRGAADRAGAAQAGRPWRLRLQPGAAARQAAQAQSARNRAGTGARLAAFAVAGQSGGRGRRIHQSVPDARGEAARGDATSSRTRSAYGQHRFRPGQARCRSSSFRPIRPDRCMSDMAAAPRTARASPTCWRPRASRSTREYYVNDAGRQMDILALSTWLRYLELQRAERAVSAQRLSRATMCATWRRPSRSACGAAMCTRRSAARRRCPVRRGRGSAPRRLDRQRQAAARARTTRTSTTSR